MVVEVDCIFYVGRGGHDRLDGIVSDSFDVFDGAFVHGRETFGGNVAEVGGEDGVFERPAGVIRGEGFGVEDIQPGTGDGAVFEGSA